MSLDEAPAPGAIPDLLLIRRIGKGGFGEVWLAENRTTGGLRAVKLLALDRSGTAALAGREIAALSRLERNRSIKHPHLLAIHHVGKTDKYLYYTMDLADDISGRPASRSADYTPATLGSRLRSERLSPDACVAYAQQLLAALACLHREGLVHRDVKPDNCVFVDGELKLADFGLVTDSDTTVSCAGTLKYMPRDRIMDVQADVYAAGLVIYELYSGNTVERFPSLASTAGAVLHDPRLEALNRTALRAADPTRASRYADAQAMLADLENALASHASATDVGLVGRTANRLARLVGRKSALITTAVVLAVGIVALGVWLGRGGPPTPAGAKVEVNFITEPYGATILLDGVMLTSGGEAYTTPCTVPELTAEVHQVVFQHPRCGVAEAGRVDFATIREVGAYWNTPSAEK
jgi:hypothetical protein